MAASPNLLPWFETARYARLLTMRPSALELHTHPEVPAHYTTGLELAPSCAGLEGRRPIGSRRSRLRLSWGRRPSGLARPKEAGRAVTESMLVLLVRPVRSKRAVEAALRIPSELDRPAYTGAAGAGAAAFSASWRSRSSLPLASTSRSTNSITATAAESP